MMTQVMTLWAICYVWAINYARYQRVKCYPFFQGLLSGARPWNLCHLYLIICRNHPVGSWHINSGRAKPQLAGGNRKKSHKIVFAWGVPATLAAKTIPTTATTMIQGHHEQMQQKITRTLLSRQLQGKQCDLQIQNRERNSEISCNGSEAECRFRLWAGLGAIGGMSWWVVSLVEWGEHGNWYWLILVDPSWSWLILVGGLLILVGQDQCQEMWPTWTVMKAELIMHAGDY